MNTFRTGLLMAALMGLFLAVGYLLGREQGMLIAFILAAGMNLFAIGTQTRWFCACMARNRLIAGPRLNSTEWLRELAHRAELPMPKVYLIDNPQPNAFATGRNPENAAGCRNNWPASASEPR
jgi:heat shock protein HtpX